LLSRLQSFSATRPAAWRQSVRLLVPLVLAAGLARYLAPAELRAALAGSATNPAAYDWTWLSGGWVVVLVTGGVGWVWLYWKQDVAGRTIPPLDVYLKTRPPSKARSE
jgi:hypothetical protein